MTIRQRDKKNQLKNIRHAVINCSEQVALWLRDDIMYVIRNRNKNQADSHTRNYGYSQFHTNYTDPVTSWFRDHTRK